MAELGAALDDLRSASRLFTDRAAALRRIAQRLDQRIVHDLSRMWRGGDAAHLTEVWQRGHQPSLLALADDLDRVSAVLNRQADDQERTSSGEAPVALFTALPPVARWKQVDSTAVDAALIVMRKALDPGGWGVTHSDLTRIRNTIASLTPAEREALLASLSDDEIRRWRDQMGEGQAKGGFSQSEQAEMFTLMTQGLSTTGLHRFLLDDAPIVSPQGTFSDTAMNPLLRQVISDLRPNSSIGEDQIMIRKLGNGNYIVELPGVIDLTDNLTTPWGFDAPNALDSARDMHYAQQVATGSGGSIGGENGYAAAVKWAMQSAGIERGANVMLVGHSFGAYTAMDLASDAGFNTAADVLPGYHVNVTHVLALGADTDWMAHNVRVANPSTNSLILNNKLDVPSQGESLVGLDGSATEIRFVGGIDGAGHDPSNYASFVSGTADPRWTSFVNDAATSYADGGSEVVVTVKDPYR